MNNPAPETVVSTPPLSPFHTGEQTVQTRAGVREQAEARGQRMLTPELVDAQREFFGRLPFVITSHLDGSGQPIAGLVTGEPGFIHVFPDGRVRVRRGGTPSPAAPDTLPGDPIGLLGIEFERRRRNRINGIVQTQSSDEWTLTIDQGYGNCPKYISKRPWDARLFGGRYVVDRSARISARAGKMIRRADAFFIASSSGPRTDAAGVESGAWGADMSHRGGEPGFVHLDGQLLSFDDYPGNNLFNTLGNLQQYPRCGLLILDFETGDILQLSGTAELHFDGARYSVAVTLNNMSHWRRDDA